MDTYKAAMLQQINSLGKSYTPYRTDEDAYYAAHCGFEPPAWLSVLIAAIGARRHRPEPQPTPIHATQMA